MRNEFGEWEDALNNSLETLWKDNIEVGNYVAYVNDIKFMFVKKDKLGHEMINMYISDFGDIEIRYDDKMKRGEVLLIPKKYNNVLKQSKEVTHEVRQSNE